MKKLDFFERTVLKLAIYFTRDTNKLHRTQFVFFLNEGCSYKELSEISGYEVEFLKATQEAYEKYWLKAFLDKKFHHVLEQYYDLNF